MTGIQDYMIWAPKFETTTQPPSHLLTRVKSRDASASKNLPSLSTCTEEETGTDLLDRRTVTLTF